MKGFEIDKIYRRVLLKSTKFTDVTYLLFCKCLMTVWLKA